VSAAAGQLRLPFHEGRAAALERHVRELCLAHRIGWSEGGRGRAEVHGTKAARRLAIRTPPIRGQVSYFVALHEIGHLVGPGRSGTRLEREASAWRWALANAIVEPTDATRRRLGRKLRSYVTWAELRQHRRRPPVLPGPDGPFWAVLSYFEGSGGQPRSRLEIVRSPASGQTIPTAGSS
jgi:hypothetical protein